ncbi:hypothetical protein AAFN87_06995 [Solibacillus sp. CAU 1738]
MRAVIFYNTLQKVNQLYIDRMDRKIHINAEMNKMIEATKILLNLIAYAQKKIAAANLEQL